MSTEVRREEKGMRSIVYVRGRSESDKGEPEPKGQDLFESRISIVVW